MRKRRRHAAPSCCETEGGCFDVERSKAWHGMNAGDNEHAGFSARSFSTENSGTLTMGIEHQSSSLCAYGVTASPLFEVAVVGEGAAAMVLQLGDTVTPSVYTTAESVFREATAAAGSESTGSVASTMETAAGGAAKAAAVVGSDELASAPSMTIAMMLQATTTAAAVAAVAEKALQTSSTCTTAVLEAGGGRPPPATTGSSGQPMLEEEQAGCPPADILAAFSRLPAAIGRLTAAFGRLTMVPLIISKAATDKAPSGAAAHRRGQLLLKHDPPSRRASFPAPKWDPMLEVARLAGRVQSSSIGGGERLKLLEVCGPPWGVNLGVNQVLQ